MGFRQMSEAYFLWKRGGITPGSSIRKEIRNNEKSHWLNRLEMSI